MVLEDVTIGVNAYMRPSKLERVLQSIADLDERPSEVIVSDNSPEKSKNKQISERFQSHLNLRYLGLESDVGVCTSRNRLVDETSTDYLVILDDDQYLVEGIERLKRILEDDSKLGGVAPSLIEDGDKMVDARDIREENGWIVVDAFGEQKEKKTPRGIQYFIYDFVATCAIYRTEALRDIGWDENFTIGGEHLDFFLQYKRNSDWKFAVTKEVSIVHDPGPGENEDYLDERRDFEKLGNSRSYFCEKWGVKGFLFRESHNQQYDSNISKLFVKIFYTLPNIVHWKLKGTRAFQDFKNLWIKILDENRI